MHACVPHPQMIINYSASGCLRPCVHELWTNEIIFIMPTNVFFIKVCCSQVSENHAYFSNSRTNGSNQSMTLQSVWNLVLVWSLLMASRSNCRYGTPLGKKLSGLFYFFHSMNVNLPITRIHHTTRRYHWDKWQLLKLKARWAYAVTGAFSSNRTLSIHI